MKHPHQRGKHEDGNDALLYDRQTVDAEGRRGQVPHQERSQHYQHNLKTTDKYLVRMESTGVANLMIGLYQLISGVKFEHIKWLI